MIVQDKNQLSIPTEAVSSNEEACQVIDALNEEIVKHQAVGLAANQIGISKSVFIISIPETTDEGKTYYYAQSFVNPQIVSLENPFWFRGEGCLSFPDFRGQETLRYKRVVIKDLWEPEGRVFEGFPAIVVQHEMEHLLGKTFHQVTRSALGPNSPCPCGLGKKFKKCCQPKVAVLK